ncbi:acetylcholine-gated chloride channel subunit acc-3 isoform X2 [Lepeophtheirus salmonis]|uniref:acetylcholine-gated chloride channel subunit acc-3 isoform X2 n=1 Tax=Lepeophtheirus salmonis TaxID=72036 RepID=UPI003AF3A72A
MNQRLRFKCLWIFLLILVTRTRARVTEHSCSSSQSLKLCLPTNYSKFELPIPNSVNLVEIGIDIGEVLRINDKEYSVTFSSYFNVLWKEPRLQYSDKFTKEVNNSSPETLIPVNLELVNELWLPNIFIYNLKTFKVVEVLSKHAGLWITSEKDILYSQATHITFICPMRFDAFPLDTQRCKFQVGSYSYDDTKMRFAGSPRVTGYAETSRAIVLDYDIQIKSLKMKDMIYHSGTLGNYSLAGFEMVLHRYVSHYIITYYLPSGLFVVVSWISFVVPPTVIPGRMALLITLFLVLVNIFNSVTTNTPKAEGLTAIEAWMLACILFVFGALVEYAVILFRKQSSMKSSYQEEEDESMGMVEPRKRNIITKKMRDEIKHELVQPPPTSPVNPDNASTHTANNNNNNPRNNPVETNNLTSNTMNMTTTTLIHYPPHAQPRYPIPSEHLLTTTSSSSRSKVPRLPRRNKYEGNNYINVDRFFLVVMPFLFLIFNVGYWLYYGQHYLLNSEEPAEIIDH